MNNDVTRLLAEAEAGNREALDRVLPLVYDELRAMAHNQLRGERPDHTLNTTALVHEAYVKLVGQDRVGWQNRRHFFAVAAMAIRRILVNHARDRSRQKRGGGVTPLALEEGLISVSDDRLEEVLEVDRLLELLSRQDERAARVVELRFFGGLSVEETADVLTVSEPTIKRSWRFAKTWLKRELG